MNKKQLVIEYNIFEHNKSKRYAQLYEIALTAAKETSYAPYSNFHVGAAVLLANGEIVKGANQENVAYPSGLCAERVALFSANVQYPNVKIEALAIIAIFDNEVVQEPPFPCGACRQVISEIVKRQNSDFDVIVFSNTESFEIKASALLPFAFTF